MTNLPILKSHKVNAADDLELKIHSVLQNHKPQHTTKLYKKYNKKMRFLSSSIDKIHSSRSSIKNDQHKSPNIDSYIREKFTPQELSIRDIMIEPHNRNNLSFETYDKSEAFRTLSKKKRKFGEFWKEISVSFDYDSQPQFSDLQTKSFDGTSCRNVKQRVEKSKKVNTIIKDYLLKKLGLKSNEKSIKLKQKKKIDIGEKPEHQTINKDNITFDRFADTEYLNQDYRDNSRQINHLKIEKIMIAQHKRTRLKRHFFY